MKKLPLLLKLPSLLLLAICTFSGCGSDNDEKKEGGDDAEKEVVISFEDQLTANEAEFKTTDGEVDGWYTKTYIKDTKNLIELPHYYSIYEGVTSFGGGFTYTNKTDKTTPGYSNNSAITTVGKFGKVYLTSTTNSFTPAKIKNLQVDKYSFKGAWITNSTYAYLAIKDGNDGSEPARVKGPFTNGDWFKITAIGQNSKGEKVSSVDFYLADFRNGKTEITNTWVWFDWSKLKDAETITFELSSSDTDEDPSIGMYTPAYFCLDSITLTEK